MAFFDRFKSSKAQEIQDSKGVKAKPVAKQASDTKKESTQKEKKSDKVAPKGKEVKSGKAGSGSAGKATSTKSTGSDKRVSGRLATIIERPLVTEKAAGMATDGKYTFVVRNNANKIEINQAIRAMYGVTPVSVNVQNVHGKRLRFGRSRGKRSSWRKAIVTLPKGKTIDVYEGV